MIALLETTVLHPEIIGERDPEVVSPQLVARWITWTGGRCPLREGEAFDLRYRDGIETGRTRVAEGPWLLDEVWEHLNVGGDIVAYRVRG